MSSEDIRENEDTGQLSSGEDLTETKREEFEEKIEAAMSSIITDVESVAEEDLKEEDQKEKDFIKDQILADEPDIEKKDIQKIDTKKKNTKTIEKKVQENRNSENKSISGSKPARKSARPRKITYVPITEADLEKTILPVKKKHKGLKVTGMVLGMIAVTAACAYGGISYYYANRFFEGTTINGIDCSGMTAYETEQVIAERVENYSIEVSSRNLASQTIDGASINYQYLSDGEVLKLLKQQKPYEWIKGYFEPVSYTTATNTSFDKTLLETQLKELSCAQEENQVQPENAYVAFNENQFEIVPETQGSKLQLKEAYKALDEAISGSQPSVDFNICENVYASADVVSTDPELQATVDAYNNFAQASITYTFGDQSETLDGTTIKDWLQFDEKGQLVKDDASFKQHVVDFVAQLAATYDTVGTSRPFNTTNGRTVYVYGSAYGWKIDQAAEVEQLMQDIRSGTQTTRDPIYSMTANSHGYNDFGNTYIEVDLSYQHMYYYQDGAIIFDSDIVSGDMRYEDRQTPPGVFTLYYKKSPDVLRGQKKEDGTYEYETEVNFWMPFNGGIGFHDATWQPYFGGNRFMEGGSHGCINMPYSSAATLYSIIQYGVPIICFY